MQCRLYFSAVTALALAVTSLRAGANPGEDKSVDLKDALARKLITVQCLGDGLTSVRLEITSTSASPLRVRIPPGTQFTCNGKSQNMGSYEDEFVQLQAKGDRETVDVSAVCLNMERDIPSKNDSFRVSGNAGGDVQKLLESPRLARASLGIRQAAVWTVTDNPKRSEYKRVVVSFGNFPAHPPSGPAITDEDARKMLGLILAAGLRPDDYRVFDNFAWTVELADAIDGKLVSATIRGAGRELAMEIKNLGRPFKLTISPGTLFATESPTAEEKRIQQCVVVKPVEFQLAAGKTMKRKVPVLGLPATSEHPSQENLYRTLSYSSPATVSLISHERFKKERKCALHKAVDRTFGDVR